MKNGQHGQQLLGAESDVVAVEKSQARKGLIGLISLAFGAAFGGLAHNQDKHREVSRAREILAKDKRQQEMRDFIESESWNTSRPKGYNTAKAIMEENKGIAGLWHAQSRDMKMFWGALAGSMVLGPILEYVAASRAAKKLEEKQHEQETRAMEALALQAQPAAAQEPAATGKSFAGAIEARRQDSEHTPARG